MSIWTRLRDSILPRAALAAPVVMAAAPEEPVVDRRVRRVGPTPPKGREGNPGTRWSGWRPSAETTAELQGRAWPVTAKKMLRTDPKLAGIVRILINALLAARYEVEPGDGSAEASRNADYVRRAFGLGDYTTAKLRAGSLEGELEKMYQYLPVGFRVLEEVYYVGEDGYVWLDQWADTEPESIKEWKRDEVSGELVEIVQENTPGSLPTAKPIDAGKCLVLTLDQSGDNYEGVGMLRACWGWWRLKQHIEDQIAVGAMRWANPSPVVQADRQLLGQAGYGPDETDANMAEAWDSVQEYVSDETSAFRIPGGILLDTFGEGAYDPAGLLSVVSQANAEMMSSFSAQFEEMGLGDVGSRAVGQVHLAVWRASITQAADRVCRAINGSPRPGGGTIARLLGFNFYAPGVTIPTSKLPRLRHVGLDVDGLADALGNVAALVGAGALTPSDDLEDRLRRMMGLRSGSTPAREWSDRLGRAEPEAQAVSDGGRPSTTPSIPVVPA